MQEQLLQRHLAIKSSMEIVFPELVRGSNRFRRTRQDDVTRSTQVSPRSPARGLPRLSLVPVSDLHKISLLGRNRMQLLRTKRRAEPLSPLSLETKPVASLAGIRLRVSALRPGLHSPDRSRLRSLALELPAVALHPAD